MTNLTLGQRIAERRKLLGFSQEAFGDKMGVSRQAISKWEADAATPEIEKLIAMSKLFDVSVGWLLGTEENEQDLSAKIKMAFQPPKPAPVPTEPPAPPAPEPEEPPKQTISHWLLLSFAAVTFLSLILSIVCLVKLNRQPQPTVSETVVTEDPRFDELMSEIKRVDSFTERVLMTFKIDNNDVREMAEKLNALMAILGTSTDLPDATVTLPSYEHLTNWSLTGAVDTDISKVTITFGATASDKVHSARLSVFRENNEITAVDCSTTVKSLFAQVELPAADGYEYILTLTLADGSTQRNALTNHGLSDLNCLALPQLRPTAKSIILSPQRPCFSQGWFNIYLGIPYLADPSKNYQWSDLTIHYYHNDGLVEQRSLNQYTTAVDLNANSIAFSLETQTFNMRSLEDGDIHDIRLTGMLTIDGEENEFSLPLIGWVVRNEQFVKITN